MARGYIDKEPQEVRSKTLLTCPRVQVYITSLAREYRAMPPWATVIDCSIYSVLQTCRIYIYIYTKAATYSRSYVAQHESIGNNWNSSQDTWPLENPFCHQHRHRSPSSIQIVATDFFFWTPLGLGEWPRERERLRRAKSSGRGRRLDFTPPSRWGLWASEMPAKHYRSGKKRGD